MLVITFYCLDGMRPLSDEQIEVHRETLHKLIEVAVRYPYLHRISINLVPQGYLSLLEPPKEGS